MFNKKEFEIALIRKSVKKNELAKALNIDVSTLYRKIENNGDFSREQIVKIMEFLDISDPKPIFFDLELAQEARNGGASEHNNCQRI